jgi:CRISPR/Cas system CSM-associated protein Csm2 small subunit
LVIEKAQDLLGNGNYAKSLAKMKSLTILHPPQQLRIAGQNFTRTDLIDKDVYHEALLDTTARNYFLLFQFHGRTREEIEALVKTMESTLDGY